MRRPYARCMRAADPCGPSHYVVFACNFLWRNLWLQLIGLAASSHYGVCLLSKKFIQIFPLGGISSVSSFIAHIPSNGKKGQPAQLVPSRPFHSIECRVDNTRMEKIFEYSCKSSTPGTNNSSPHRSSSTYLPWTCDAQLQLGQS